MFPPIVTFCLRWYAAPTHAVCVDQDCSISWYTSLLWPLVFYSFWQVRLPLGLLTLTRPQLAYLLKTELIDADKMKKDKELVTSLRWMTVRSTSSIHSLLTPLRTSSRIPSTRPLASAATLGVPSSS